MARFICLFFIFLLVQMQFAINHFLVCQNLTCSFHQEKSDTHSANSLFDVDILLTRGIGNGAIQKLAMQNVVCYKIEETDPDTAINKLIKGTLEAMSPVSHDKSGCNCGGHHHHH